MDFDFTTFGINSFVYSDANSNLSSVSGTNGQLLIGSTGAIPVLSTLTAGTGISVNNSTGSITLNNSGVLSNVAGTDISVSGATGNVTINDTSTLSTVTSRGATTSSAISITNSTVSTSGTTGALIVTGGVGISGRLSSGTLTYSDSGILSSFQTSINSYNQLVLQNTNAGTTASSDFIVSNDSGTATTFYGDFGINSSTFSGTSSFSLPSAVYLTATSGDLSIGTTTSNAIHFVVNSGVTDIFRMGTAGQFGIGTNFGTSGQVFISQGSASAPAWATTKRLPQLISGTFTPATGTTNVPYDGTVPASNEGTQVWTQAITPTATTSVISINISTVIGYAATNAAVILSLYRGTTNIGTVCFSVAASGILGAAAAGSCPATFSLIDSPASVSAQTYSLRIGSSTGNWYFGRTDTQTLGNATAGNFILNELV